MVFSSSVFLFLFLPIFLFTYIASKRIDNLVLLVFSLLFYFFGEGYYVAIMAICILVNYVVGLRIFESKYRDYWLTAGIAFNLSMLLFFKYMAFFIGDVMRIDVPESISSIHLPIGISFFIFQSISYLVDVRRKDVQAETSLIRLGAYIAMFPQLIAGPIVRFKTVARQLRRRQVRIRSVYYGAAFFCVGLASKVLIADTLAVSVDLIFSRPPNESSVASLWFGAVAYSLQIFFDFSGYSAMAIGLGLWLGFVFPQNFNFPYTSASVTEFWRRWHMSLSSWFRDYVYIPLGGNRYGSVQTYRNLILVFLATGLWHGAALNFVFWGLYHGAFLILERTILKSPLAALPRLAGIVYTLGVVLFGWIFFRAGSFEYAIEYISGMFNLRTSSPEYTLGAYLNNEQSLIFSIGLVAATPLFFKLLRGRAAMPEYGAWKSAQPIRNYYVGIAIFAALFLASAIKIVAGSYSPFIYFRF